MGVLITCPGCGFSGELTAYPALPKWGWRQCPRCEWVFEEPCDIVLGPKALGRLEDMENGVNTVGYIDADELFRDLGIDDPPYDPADVFGRP